MSERVIVREQQRMLSKLSGHLSQLVPVVLLDRTTLSNANPLMSASYNVYFSSSSHSIALICRWIVLYLLVSQHQYLSRCLTHLLLSKILL